MRTYSNRITLARNDRGIYSLDTTIGCHSGTKDNRNGCYNDCYAAKIARIYGYDFTKTVLRYFENERHRLKIVRQIEKIPLPFVRIGTMGDPSENWEHTLNVCAAITHRKQLTLFPRPLKQIVIITKHWQQMTSEQLKYLADYNICINTSVSALDDPYQLDVSLNEYERLKPYCKSILRVVSADFNLNNPTGHELHKVQADLFKRGAVLDTVLRVSPKNEYVTKGVINIKKSKFLGKNCYISKYNKKTYFGKCGSCLEMCGVNIKPMPVENISP